MDPLPLPLHRGGGRPPARLPQPGLGLGPAPKDYKYQWNEWELRRLALKLADLRNKRTRPRPARATAGAGLITPPPPSNEPPCPMNRGPPDRLHSHLLQHKEQGNPRLAAWGVILAFTGPGGTDTKPVTPLPSGTPNTPSTALDAPSLATRFLPRKRLAATGGPQPLPARCPPRGGVGPLLPDGREPLQAGQRGPDVPQEAGGLPDADGAEHAVQVHRPLHRGAAGGPSPGSPRRWGGPSIL